MRVVTLSARPSEQEKYLIREQRFFEIQHAGAVWAKIKEANMQV